MSEKVADNSKPVKIAVDGAPCYQRKYVLPLASAVQSKESWRWPPPEPPDYDLLDRILNTTTLTTQCLTHKHILAIGEKAHADLTTDLKERISEIENMQKNFIGIVSQEVQKVKGEMEARYKKLLANLLNDQQGNRPEHRDSKLQTMLELEKEKVERLNIEWQLRLEDALLKQREELDAEHRKQLEEALKTAQYKLDIDIDKRLAEALQKQLEMLETTPGTGGFRDKLDRKIAEFNDMHEKEMNALRRDLAAKHEAEAAQMKSKWLQMCDRYKQLLEFSRNVERDYFLLEDDFKRFINNVKGAGGYFSSDYLIRSKQHGLIVTSNEETSNLDKAPDFNKMEKRSKSRQLGMAELSASFDDPAFWPDNFFQSKSSQKDQSDTPKYEGLMKLPRPDRTIISSNLIPVKLVRPLDSDEIGNVVLPVRIPEKNGASFILSLNDF